MSEQYIEIEAGEKIQAGDEYSADNGIWRMVPAFMVGDIVPESKTMWRRSASTIIKNTPKKKWFSFLFN
jgi:hypothetical protein